MLKIDQNSVQPRPATEARFRPADFASAGEEIARGAANLGAGLDEAARNIDKIDEMYDEAAVKQADTEDLTQIMKLKAEALTATGFEAQTAVQNARQQIDEIRKARMSTLRGGRQQRLYSDVFDQRNLQIEESFSNHLARQVADANKNAAAGRAEAYMNNARDTFGTPEFEKSLATGEAEVAVVNRGAGDAVIGLAQAKYRSQVYSGVIENMIADPNRIREAKSVLDEHAGDILPEDETRLRKMLNPLIEEDQTESDAGWAFTNSPVPGADRDPLAALPDPQKGEPYYPTEGPDTPPRPSITGPSSRARVIAKPVSPTDPTRGKGRVSNTAAQHRARGSGNALDIAAPPGTPIYPPMSGKVIKNWWSKEGGWSVLVEHPNGYVTGYAHLRSQSALREGQAVDADTVIGGVGMTGTKATGPHVHYTVRQSRAGPKVDPNAVDWGDTVKPESVDWKEGPLTRYQADDNSLGRALDRIHQRATAENWSPRRYNSAVARARQIAGIQGELYNQQAEDRWRGALQTVVDLGDKLTSRTQIKGFGQLEPQHQLAIDNIIKQNLNPSEEGKANGEVFLDLMDMSIDPARRADFLNVDLLKESRITRGERARLVARQTTLRTQPNNALSGRLDDAWSAANRYLPKGKNSPFTDAQRQLFADRYMEAVTARQNEQKRPLEDREKDDIARALAVHAIRRGAGGERTGEGMLFEYIGRDRAREGGVLQVDTDAVYAQIAPETRDRIIADLKQRGHPYTANDVVQVYLRMRR